MFQLKLLRNYCIFWVFQQPASDFISGEFTLTSLEGTEGRIINSGIINAATGGSVSLVGKQVENAGVISARLGAVNLMAGNEAVVTFD